MELLLVICSQGQLLVKALGFGGQKAAMKIGHSSEQTQHTFLCVPRAVIKTGLIHHSIHLFGHSSFTP